MSMTRVGKAIFSYWPDEIPRDAEHTAPAWSVIDPERVSSVIGIMKSYHDRIAQVNADKSLSPVGKAEKVAAITESTFGNVATLAKRVARLEEEHRQDDARATAEAIPKADPSETLIDIELARIARAEGKIPTALEHANPRFRMALARVPAEISGITEQTRARLRGSLVDPQVASVLGERAEALGLARNAVQRAITELMKSVQIAGEKPRKLAAMVGPGWGLQGGLRSESMVGAEQLGDTGGSQ